MKNRSQPLTVYLDASDFSNLSNPARQTADMMRIGEYLERVASEGRVEFRFSCVHMLEVAPNAPEYVEPALRRFQKIYALCGLRCFAPYTWLVEQEVRRAAGASLVRGLLRRDDGEWFPDFDFGFPSLEEIMRNLLSHLSYVEQLATAPRLFNQQGRLSQESRDAVAAALPQIISMIKKSYPLTPAAAHTIEWHFQGSGRKGDVVRGLKASMARPDVFGEWYTTQWDQLSTLASSLRETGRKTKETLDRMTKDASDFYSKWGEEALSEREKNALFEQSLPDLARRLGNTLAEEKTIRVASRGWLYTWENAPSLMTASHLFAHVARRTAMLPGRQRTSLPSDFGDLLHALYLPHVDVFRADGFLSSVIKEANLPWATTVVSKLADLPSALEKRLTEQA